MSLPIIAVKPIIQVDRCFTDKFVPKKVVVVVGRNDNASCAWEPDIELETFVERWVWLVQLVVVSFVEFLIITLNNQVWVWFWSDVLLGEIKAFEHVEVDCCWHLIKFSFHERVMLPHFEEFFANMVVDFQSF